MSLDIVLAKQNLGAAGRITQETAVPIGEVERAELLIAGSVTGFEENVSTNCWAA